MRQSCGGTQNSGESGYYSTQTNTNDGTRTDADGSFGKGGTSGRYSSYTVGSGGGGGWYGGGSSPLQGGAGGSGYVNSSLSDGNTIAGNTQFTAPGGGTETGHTGSGYARITMLG